MLVEEAQKLQNLQDTVSVIWTESQHPRGLRSEYFLIQLPVVVCWPDPRYPLGAGDTGTLALARTHMHARINETRGNKPHAMSDFSPNKHILFLDAPRPHVPVKPVAPTPRHHSRL